MDLSSLATGPFIAESSVIIQGPWMKSRTVSDNLEGGSHECETGT